MFQIVKFYFDIIAQIINQVWGSFEIFPGINYSIWIFGIGFILLTLSIIKFFHSNSTLNALKQAHENRVKQDISEGTYSRYGYSPRHAYKPKHVKR